MVDYSGDRTGDNTEFLKRVTNQLFNEINCCIPARIESFDPATQQIECIPMIRRRVKNSDGSNEIVDYEKLIKVPLLTPYVRILGFSITMPISPGDICLLLFADKPIDLWQETGDISDPPELSGTRNHHLTDGIAMLAPIPLPNAILDYQIDSVEVRNLDRTTALQVWDEQAEVRAKPGNYTTWKDTSDIDHYSPANIFSEAGSNIEDTAGVNLLEDAGTNIEETAGTDIKNTAGANHNTVAQGGKVTENASTNIEETAGTEIKNTAPTVTISGNTAISIAGGTVSITSPSTVTVTAPAINLNGAVTVTGSLTVTGAFAAQTTAVVTGTLTAGSFGGAGGAAATFNSGLTASVTAMFGGIEHIGHVHQENDIGGDTGPAK